MGAGIVQFIDPPGSFSGLVGLHPFDAQVEVVVIVGSAWVGSWAGLLQAHPSVFACKAISVISSGHPTKHHAQQTTIYQ